MRAVVLLSIAALTAACASRARSKPEVRLSCAGPHTLADSANGRVHGRATDARDGAPLAGIVVSVAAGDEHHETITDAAGEWEIGNLHEGHYAVVLHRGTTVLYSAMIDLCPEDVVRVRTPLLP